MKLENRYYHGTPIRSAPVFLFSKFSTANRKKILFAGYDIKCFVWRSMQMSFLRYFTLFKITRRGEGGRPSLISLPSFLEQNISITYDKNIRSYTWSDIYDSVVSEGNHEISAVLDGTQKMQIIDTPEIEFYQFYKAVTKLSVFNNKSC